MSSRFNLTSGVLLLALTASVGSASAPKASGVLEQTATRGNASAFQCDFPYTLRRNQVLVLECNQPPPQPPGLPPDAYPPESPIQRMATIETGNVAVQGWISHTYESLPLAGANAVLWNLGSQTVSGRARVTVTRPRPELSVF